MPRPSDEVLHHRCGAGGSYGNSPVQRPWEVTERRRGGRGGPSRIGPGGERGGGSSLPPHYNELLAPAYSTIPPRRGFQMLVYLYIGVARCMGPVRWRGDCRGDSGPLGPGLRRMLDADFGEHLPSRYLGA